MYNQMKLLPKICKECLKKLVRKDKQSKKKRNKSLEQALNKNRKFK